MKVSLFITCFNDTLLLPVHLRHDRIADESSVWEQEIQA